MIIYTLHFISYKFIDSAIEEQNQKEKQKKMVRRSSQTVKFLFSFIFFFLFCPFVYKQPNRPQLTVYHITYKMYTASNSVLIVIIANGSLTV